MCRGAEEEQSPIPVLHLPCNSPMLPLMGIFEFPAVEKQTLIKPNHLPQNTDLSDFLLNMNML